MLTPFAFHLIGADHEARGRGKWRPGGVFERLAGLERRLLADHARTLDLLHPPPRIGDLPVAGAERHRLEPMVFDSDGIGPDEMIIVGPRLAFEVFGLDDDADAAG